MTAPPDTGPADRYPSAPTARDRFVMDRRGPRSARDPFAHQGVLLEDEPDAQGRLVRTATVFLTGRECPWRCVMCDLWRYTTAGDTPRGAIARQIRAAIDMLRERHEAAVAVKLYNAGSYFDRRAVPEADDAEIVQTLAPFGRVIVESHPALVGDRTWRLRDALAARGTALEVAMGLETAHPQALDALNKRITVAQFEATARALRQHDVALRTFLLVHPPFVPGPEQRLWLSRSVAVADGCGATAISLIPTRGDEGAMRALVATGAFVPPRLSDIETAAGDARAATSSRVFVDLWDFDRFASCDACGPLRRERLRQFNMRQVLGPPGTCGRCGEAAAA